MYSKKIIQHVFSHIKADPHLKEQIFQRLEEEEMKPIKKNYKKAIALAACITIIGLSTVYAASPTFQQAVGNALSYFKSEKANQISKFDALQIYNKEIGLSCIREGITLTVDNIATDDNFLHIFYTIHSDEEMQAQYLSPSLSIFMNCKINSQAIGWNNHNSYDGYYEDAHTFKGVAKINVSQQTLPEQFQIEIYTDRLNGKTTMPPDMSQCLYESNAFTQEQIDNLWYVTAVVNKADVKEHSVIINPNVTAQLNGQDVTVKKVVLSPFGNQIVLRSKNPVMGFGLFDDNGTSLDVLNTGLSAGIDDEYTENSYEFLKANTDTKAITIVPLKEKAYADTPDIIRDIGTYPIEFQQNETGKAVVTDVRMNGAVVEIDYYYDGFMLYDPDFSLLDSNGKQIDKFVLLDYRINYDTNSYTAVYTFYQEDAQGNTFAPTADTLKKIASISKLAFFKNDSLEPDYANSIRIELQ